MQSVLTERVLIEGTLLLDGPLHLEGRIRGEVQAGDTGNPELVVAASGKVEGNIRVPVVTIFGTVVGSIVASRSLTLMPGARVEGSVCYGTLSIHQGAILKGQVVQGSSPVKSTETRSHVEPLAQDPAFSNQPSRSTA